MASHDILLQPAVLQADMEQGQMDDASFRKMAEEIKRPRPGGVSLFRPASAVQPPAMNGQSTDLERAPEPLRLSPPNPERVWESLSAVRLDTEILNGNGLFPNVSTDPAAAAFDVLRTRILQAMQDRGWRRIAVTSPTHGCGKSFVAANLALSLARRASSRTVLLDLELRNPQMANLLGFAETAALRDFLTGEQPLESHFLRVGRSLALGLNGVPVPDAAELLQEPETAAALAAMIAQLDPQIAIYDLPPALVGDDVLAILPRVDAVLLVADGTKTSPADVRASERLFEGRCPLMGVVLNRAQDRGLSRYRYGRK